ncbi:MAG: flagellar basal body-associated FliL family protein [Oscillospiraceae bacterium]|nr:flagellar basal body-associated FliL family protein [Oscillospiraceae bacterium]
MMKKSMLSKIAIIIPIILIALFVISACDSPEPRILTSFYYTPGGPFTTNVNDNDPRRRIRCTIVFEVVDERAIEELDEVVFKVRSSVLSVLGELTIPEITTHRDFEDISRRLIERINEDLPTDHDLFKQAYFTEFALE